VVNDLKTKELTRVKKQIRLAKLWDAALSRSPDIQFVFQHLLGNNSISRLKRALSHLSQGSTGLWALADREDPGYPKDVVPVSDFTDPRFTSCGFSCLRRLCSDKEHRISQTEAIMLFDMAQRVADSLTSAYSDYSSTLSQLKAATGKIETEQASDLRKKLVASRQKLVTLAGETAVDELDSELDEESKTNSNI
jgi:hypothetical protein